LALSGSTLSDEFQRLSDWHGRRSQPRRELEDDDALLHLVEAVAQTPRARNASNRDAF
jgi:hypothetical protein